MRKQSQRRGSAYLVVLGVTMIVSTLAYSGILVARSRARALQEVSDASEARQIAQDAVEIAKFWIQSDPNWRMTRTQPIWATDMALGPGNFSLEVSDPVDGDVGNFPHDLLVVKATGKKGIAKHVLQVTLNPTPVPLPALQFAAHTAGELHIRAGKTLSVANATASTNGELRNDGTIAGNVRFGLLENLGIVTGTKTTGVASTSLPSASIADKYAAVGTLINATGLDKKALGPGYNPFGTANPDGIYVIRPSADFSIKNSHICGTLVVITSKKVTIDNNVLLHPYRSDCPALIVAGDADIIFDGGDNLLVEPGVNLNPVGAPYAGSENNLTTDKFPSEIQGLVHVTGDLKFNKTAKVRGAIMVNSAAVKDAFDVNDTPTIVYTPSLFTSPPCWYTTSVPMVTKRGSYLHLPQ